METKQPRQEHLIFDCLERIQKLDNEPNRPISEYSLSHSVQTKKKIADLLKECLKDLFQISVRDAEFYAYAKMLLSMFFKQQEDKIYDFDVRISPRSDTIDMLFEQEDTPTVSFEYDKPLRRPRTNWHTFFMDQAFQAAERSSCASGRRVGATFVKNKAPLVTSYNGVPSKYPHPVECPRLVAGCVSGEGLDMCPCNHAEMNGLAIAANKGISLAGSILYCTSKPCAGCMGILANVGLDSIVYHDDYPHPLSKKISDYAKLKVFSIHELLGVKE